VYVDSSNDSHVGFQASPASGNGTLSLYAKGSKLLNLTASPSALSPETDQGVALGNTVGPKRFTALYAMGIRLDSDSGSTAKANIALQSGDYSSHWLTLWGPAAAAASYNLYFPNAQGAANQTLINDGSGNLSWQTPASSGISGSGTINDIPKFTGTGAIGNSSISDNGATVTIAENVNISSGSLGVGSSTVVDSSRNATFTSLTIGSTSTIDSSRNGSLVSLGLTGTLTMANAEGLYWKDSGGTARLFANVDNNNDVFVGLQAAPVSGNGILALYAKGVKLLDLSSSPAALYPEGDQAMALGTTSKRYGAIYTMYMRVDSDSGAGAKANIALQSGDYTSHWATIWGPPAASANWQMYLPNGQASVAGQALVNDASGNLSWAGGITGTCGVCTCTAGRVTSCP